MGQKDGIWYCDVCDGAIATGKKRYPLDAGRICCAECWEEIKGMPAEIGTSAPEVKRSEESKHIVLDLFGIGKFLFGTGKLSKTNRTVDIGATAGLVIGLVAGALLGLAWGIHEGDALTPTEYGGRPDIAGAIIGIITGGLFGCLVGYLFGLIAAKPEK